MIFSIVCKLENEELPIDYRRKIVSFLKYSLSKDDKEFYDELYGIGRNTNKGFTFSVYFYPETLIKQDSICVKSKKMIINLSTPDQYLGIKLYNALSKQRLSWFKLSKDNAIRIVEIHYEKERVITQNKTAFNTLSPIVVRDHDRETGKDWFYTYEDSQIIEILKRNLKQELKEKFQRDISKDIDELKIEFVKMKKIIVKSYELKIPCSLGLLSMEGEQYLLQYLSQRGIGSKRSLGFGMLQAK